jgi:hypothetical protein
VTSENQEIEIGEATTDMDFSYEAEPGHEITGFLLRDGIICGVKQAVLAPSRVSPVPSLPAQGDFCGGLESLKAQIEVASRQKLASRRQSLETLIRGKARRMKEAEEADEVEGEEWID